MIKVQREDFDPGYELEQMRIRCHGSAGAVVSFTGLVRDMNAGGDVMQLTLEHYPGMTEKALLAIEKEAGKHWNLQDSLIIHRIGPLLPNEYIVLVAVASAHRKPAFRACEFIIDSLKKNAPFWKKETRGGEQHWLSPCDST